MENEIRSTLIHNPYGFSRRKINISKLINYSSMKNTFNRSGIEKRAKELSQSEYKYTIGASKCNGDFGYSLIKERNGDIEILLSNTISDESEFDNTIKTLAKCFNAEIHRDYK